MEHIRAYIAEIEEEREWDESFKRQWPSLYAALGDSRISPNRVMKQVTSLVATGEQPILAGDCSSGIQPDAKTAYFDPPAPDEGFTIIRHERS